MHPLRILRSVRLSGGQVWKDGSPVPLGTGPDPAPTAEAVYRSLGASYPKFFKMDPLCKWAWLGAEILLTEAGLQPVYGGINRAKTAVLLATGAGCLDVDKRYLASMDEVPSPALFVYTLPNIMLGEICIRHGFTGEQLCLVQPAFDTVETQWYAADLLERGAEACLCGWVDATAEGHSLAMAWIGKSADETKPLFTPEALRGIAQ